ncbi:hypothetical protein [Oceanobacillus bengalensis]|uniref:hypothetical protein n=1 Tax=Oceanobacillus bengalensis TaxID=1435466 RepID=UPI0036333C10
MERNGSLNKTLIDGEGMNEREQLVVYNLGFPADCFGVHASAVSFGYQKDDETIRGNQ